MQELVDVVNDLRGLISEPVRALVANKLIDMITNQIRPEDYAEWVKKGAPNYLALCGVTCNPASVPDDTTVEVTDLAKLINKWASIKMYKTDGGEFEEFTQEMDSLRRAILEDLRYGDQDNLKGVSVIALSDADMEMVYKAIEHMTTIDPTYDELWGLLKDV